MDDDSGFDRSLERFVIDGIRCDIRNAVKEVFSGENFCEDLVDCFAHDFVKYVEFENDRCRHANILAFMVQKKAHRSVQALVANHPDEINKLIRILEVGRD